MGELAICIHINVLIDAITASQSSHQARGQEGDLLARALADRARADRMAVLRQLDYMATSAARPSCEEGGTPPCVLV